MAALAVVPISRPKSLYEIESDLGALLECVETVTPEQEEAYLRDLGAALNEAKDKRDSVARWMSHCESQISLAKEEVDRLKERKAGFETSLDRLKTYVVRILDAAGVKKLEGNAVTFSLRKCPAAIEVLDETLVPLDYKMATLSMPATLADRVLDSLSIDDPVRIEFSLDKRAIKAALDNHAEIPGAAIAPDKFSLVRK